jgi:hypothetical protein
LIERVTNRTRYAVDVTSGGRSSAMSRKDVGDDLCHLEPLPRFDFRPVIANGSFTSIPAVGFRSFYVETLATSICAISGLGRHTPSDRMKKSAGSKMCGVTKSSTARPTFGPPAPSGQK